MKKQRKNLIVASPLLFSLCCFSLETVPFKEIFKKASPPFLLLFEEDKKLFSHDFTARIENNSLLLPFLPFSFPTLSDCYPTIIGDFFSSHPSINLAYLTNTLSYGKQSPLKTTSSFLSHTLLELLPQESLLTSLEVTPAPVMHAVEEVFFIEDVLQPAPSLVVNLQPFDSKSSLSASCFLYEPLMPQAIALTLEKHSPIHINLFPFEKKSLIDPLTQITGDSPFTTYLSKPLYEETALNKELQTFFLDSEETFTDHDIPAIEDFLPVEDRSPLGKLTLPTQIFVVDLLPRFQSSLHDLLPKTSFKILFEQEALLTKSHYKITQEPCNFLFILSDKECGCAPIEYQAKLGFSFTLPPLALTLSETATVALEHPSFSLPYRTYFQYIPLTPIKSHFFDEETLLAKEFFKASRESYTETLSKHYPFPSCLLDQPPLSSILFATKDIHPAICYIDNRSYQGEKALFKQTLMIDENLLSAISNAFQTPLIKTSSPLQAINKEFTPQKNELALAYPLALSPNIASLVPIESNKIVFSSKNLEPLFAIKSAYVDHHLHARSLLIHDHIKDLPLMAYLDTISPKAPLTDNKESFLYAFLPEKEAPSISTMSSYPFLHYLYDQTLSATPSFLLSTTPFLSFKLLNISSLYEKPTLDKIYVLSTASFLLDAIEHRQVLISADCTKSQSSTFIEPRQETSTLAQILTTHPQELDCLNPLSSKTPAFLLSLRPPFSPSLLATSPLHEKLTLDTIGMLSTASFLLDAIGDRQALALPDCVKSQSSTSVDPHQELSTLTQIATTRPQELHCFNQPSSETPAFLLSLTPPFSPSLLATSLLHEKLGLDTIGVLSTASFLLDAIGDRQAPAAPDCVTLQSSASVDPSQETSLCAQIATSRPQELSLFYEQTLSSTPSFLLPAAHFSSSSLLDISSYHEKLGLDNFYVLSTASSLLDTVGDHQMLVTSCLPYSNPPVLLDPLQETPLATSSYTATPDPKNLTLFYDILQNASFLAETPLNDPCLSPPLISSTFDLTPSRKKAATCNQSSRKLQENLAKLPTLQELSTLSASEEFTVELQVTPNTKEKGYLFSITLEPVEKKLSSGAPQNFIFLVDRSSSIDKNRFQVFKQAIGKALLYLKEEDTFNILAFDTEISKMSHESVCVSSSTKHGAKRFLETQKRGYKYVLPNLYEILLNVQALAKHSELPTTVVLLTNGKTLENFNTQDDLLSRLISSNQNGFTLFTACSSQNNNTLMLEILSSLNKGEFMHSQTNAAFPRKLAAFVKHAGYLIAKDIHISAAKTNPDLNIEFFPDVALAPNLYGDRPYTIIGKTDKLCDFDLVLQGRFCNNWLNITKKISFKNAKHGSHSIYKDYTVYMAYNKYREYLKEGNTVCLDEAKKVLQPFNASFPY